MVRACLRSTFSGHDSDVLREWIKRDCPRCLDRKRSSCRVLIIPPSTIFAAAWQAATAAWLAGATVVLRPSRREPVFARLLQQSVLAEAGEILPAQILKSEPGTQNLYPFTTIVVYGSDQTIQTLQHSSKTKLIGFGTKISVAYVERQGLRQYGLDDLAARAAWDTVLYETQGCLSPQRFYVEEDDHLSAVQFARKLAIAMEKLDARLPRMTRKNEKLEEEGFWQTWRFRESQGRAQIFRRRVILQREDCFEPCNLRRVVFVTPVRRPDDIIRHCGKWTKRLSTIAGSHATSLDQLKQSFGSQRGIRFCAIGEMHQPPPWWRNGGLSLLQKLAQLL